MNKSVLASILIGLGVYGLLNSNYSYLSMVLFSFGLFTICLFKLDLFTGKCGYTFCKKGSVPFLKVLGGIKHRLDICEGLNKNFLKGVWYIELAFVTPVLKVLVINLVSGYLVGLLFSLTSPDIVSAAVEVVHKWTFSLSYFIKSIFCGAIMFLAVHTYKKGSNLGIFFGVPLFIICGFQHCVANVIIMGCAQTFSYALLLAILGNWAGAVLIEKLMEMCDE